jgi:hypothetical protein
MLALKRPLNDTSVLMQHSPVYYGVIKAANTIGYLALVYLTFRFWLHRHDWQVSIGCVIISACWLILTRIKIDHLLQTYFDILSRIEMQIPVVVGIIMSFVAIFAHGNPYIHFCAITEIFGWFYIYTKYRANLRKFEKQGHGPLPRGTWLSPPADIMRPGDLILTSGNVAKQLHESVGHAETVLKMADGTLQLFSCYMEKGAFIHDMESLTERHEHGEYIVLHLRESWSDEQQKRATKIAEEMIAINKIWAARRNKEQQRVINALPLPESAKVKLEEAVHATGYDWFGTFMGRVAPDRWTCIGACLALYKQMGVQTNHYGTGLLGFGTTIFDPIMPVRFLADPAFELVKASEQRQAEPAKTRA